MRTTPWRLRDELLQQLYKPLDQLRADYFALADRVRDLGKSLSALNPHSRFEYSGVSEPEDRLEYFLESLAALPGVARVRTLNAAGDIVFQVELDDPPPGEDPTVICVQCGKVISKGGPETSHGLCVECAEKFMDEARRS